MPVTLQESLELAQKESAGGVGTLGERTLHAALKYYLQPDPAFHEIKVGRWVADIQDSWGITEIQAGGVSCPGSGDGGVSSGCPKAPLLDGPGDWGDLPLAQVP